MASLHAEHLKHSQSYLSTVPYNLPPLIIPIISGIRSPFVENESNDWSLPWSSVPLWNLLRRIGQYFPLSLQRGLQKKINCCKYPKHQHSPIFLWCSTKQRWSAEKYLLTIGNKANKGIYNKKRRLRIPNQLQASLCLSPALLRMISSCLPLKLDIPMDLVSPASLHTCPRPKIENIATKHFMGLHYPFVSIAFKSCMLHQLLKQPLEIDSVFVTEDIPNSQILNCGQIFLFLHFPYVL